MTLDEAHDHRNDAEAIVHGEQDFPRAGDVYTTSGFARLGIRPPTRQGLNVGTGLVEFLYASTCYRLGDLQQRCVDRCQMGVLIANEMRERVHDREPPDNFYERARRGVWDEFVGDFRIIAGFDDPDAAYARAQKTYRDAGDPRTGYAEQIHIGLMGFVQRIEMGLGHDMDPWSNIRSEITLSEWVEYKREHLAEFLEELVKQGEWVWEEERPE